MQTDVLVLGCGIAGTTAALRLARDRRRAITLLTRESDPERSSSSLAQGGIADRGIDDSAQLLVEDVLRAGAGLSDPAAVGVLADEGPRLLREILVGDAGVEFDRGRDGGPSLGLEAAHSRRRILHVGDATGRAIMRALLREAAARPNVTLLTGHTAVDLLTFPHHARDPLAVYRPATCHGAYALDHATGEVRTILAGRTILATGGLGQIYLNTTNPPGARGDGVAMAYRAGARVVNMEYVQFHPTALHMPGTTKTLISEAVRGEGGILVAPDGRRFMERHAPQALELAPRDVVARAIYREMIEHDLPFVLLDIASRRAAVEIRERFPWIYAHCRRHHLDITRDPIPVVPAAHYLCGGVLADSRGRTTLDRLYAIGEVACTGVHGANRLASTSLLEGLVWGARAARDIGDTPGGPGVTERDVPPWHTTGLSYDADPALIQGDLHTIRALMWHYAGLLRNRYRLERAERDLGRLWMSIEDFYRRAHLTDALIGLRNTVLNALLVARSALRNPVSRGCHFREDARPVEGAAPPDATNDAKPRAIP